MDRSKVGVLDPAGVLERRGPWTVDDWRELDLGPSVHWRQVELEHGTLVVSPTPEWQHAAAGSGLLAALLPQLPRGLRVVVPAGLALTRTLARAPDLVVLRDTAAARGRQALLPGDIVLAVEVESPSSRRRDRVDKHEEYAAAGIPAYWRVEHRVPRITAHALRGDRYVEVASVVGDEPLELAAPFPLRVVPAELLGPPTG